MTLKQVTYCTSYKPACAFVPNAEIIICVEDGALIAQPEPLCGLPLTTLLATICSASEFQQGCQNFIYQYVFSYNDEQLIDPVRGLLQSDIVSFLCQDCLIDYFQQQISCIEGGTLVCTENTDTLNLVVGDNGCISGNVIAGHVFYPETFGAVGNGIADDTAAVEAAINAASAVAGTVWFANTYVVNEADLQSNVTLDGTGTLIKKAGTTTSALACTTSEVFHDITIRNIKIDGNKANCTAGGGIVIAGKNFTLQNLNIYDTPNACINVGYRAGGGNIKILNNYCRNASLGGGNWGAIGVTGGVGILIANNILESTDGFAAYAVDIEPDGGTPTNEIGKIVITTNLIKGGRIYVDGTNLSGSDTLDSVLVVGNQIDARGAYRTGFANETPVFCRRTSGLSIKANTIYNTGPTVSANSILGIDIDTSNTLFDVAENLCLLTSPNQSTQAIRCVAGNTYGRIANNTIVGLGSFPVTVAVYAFNAAAGQFLRVYGNTTLQSVTSQIVINDTASLFSEPVQKGITGSRPIQSSINFGNLYLDTTLDADGLPIFWQGTKWIKADGTDA